MVAISDMSGDPCVRLLQLQVTKQNGVITTATAVMLSTTWPMQAPLGVAAIELEDTNTNSIFVADGTHVRRIDLPTNQLTSAGVVTALSPAFKAARSVAVAEASDGGLYLAVADSVAHQVLLY